MGKLIRECQTSAVSRIWETCSTVPVMPEENELYSTYFSHEDVSHSVVLSIILRSRSSLRIETSSLNAVCTILVWIQYKIGKDKLFLCTTWRHLRGMGIYVHLLLSLALGGSEWSASCPNHLTPRERSPNTHLIGGWVSPIFGVDFLWRGWGTVAPSGIKIPEMPAYSGVLLPTTYTVNLS